MMKRVEFRGAAAPALRPAPHCTPALFLAPPAAAPPDEEAAPPDEEAALRAMTAALLAAGPVEAVALGEACLRQNAAQAPPGTTAELSKAPPL